VVRMEPMPTPDWLPETHIYYDIQLFPQIEQLVGAIKARVIERGGRPQAMTAERRAELHVENQKFERDRKCPGSGLVSQI
jgi:hypothetical protein